MRSRVLLFAALREAAGARELTIDLPEDATAADVRDRVAAERPALAGLIGAAAVAVNEEYVPADHRLRDGDVIALIPPVSGGAVEG